MGGRMSKCEVFNKGRCFGCVGLDPQYDIDKIKKQCETYKEEMNEGEQRSIWEK